MKNFFLKNLRNKKAVSFMAVLCFALFGLFLGKAVFAAESTLQTNVAILLGHIVSGIIYALGIILTTLFKVLQWIAQYNGFIEAPAIVNGWKIVRDFANMFFILILLIIAFATILRIDSYNWKKMLPKLLIMAVLINFSKTIAGLILDFAQVIMLTFVNGFAAASDGNLTEMLGIKEILQINPDTAANVSAMSVLGSYILALLYILISIIAVLVIIAVLAMRIVMLWIYVVLSPLAFLLSAFPAGQKYSSQWWGEFSKNVIVGPVLAFFIWLSFISASSGIMNDEHFNDKASMGLQPTASITKAGTPDHMLKFIISIGMLIGGLMVTQQIGGAAGSAAGRGMAAINKGKGWATAVATKPVVWGGQKAWGGAKTTARAGVGIAGGVDRILGGAVNKKYFEGGLVGASFQKTKNAVTLDWVRNRNKNKIEADKALYEFFKKQEYAKAKGESVSDVRMSYSGKDYKKHANGSFYEVDKDGNAIGGAPTRKGLFGKEVEIKEMQGWKSDMFHGWASAHTNAWAAAKTATDTKISEEQKKIEASGIGNEMMLQQLKDKSTSDTKKMALALTLAIKEGFKGKGHQEVSLAKDTLGSNQILIKKFNDEVDKKFAHLNYDLTTDAGKSTFKKRLDAGKFDVLDSSAYSNANVIRVLEEHFDTEFAEKMKRVKDISKEYKGKLETGLDSAMQGTDAFKADGSLNPIRKAMADLTNNLKRAFGDVDPNSLSKALEKYLRNANNTQIANLDLDMFDQNKSGADFVKALGGAIEKSIDKKKVAGIDRAGASENLKAELGKYAAKKL